MKQNLKALSGVFPLPVLLISTYNEDGSVDVMNAAWGVPVSMKHIKLFLTETHKTVANLKRTMACTISLGVEDLMRESDYFGLTSANSNPNKFKDSKLHSEKSKIVDAPIVIEYPVTMECKVISFDEDGIIVEVLNILADEEYLDNGNLNLTKLNILAYDPYGRGYYKVNEKAGVAFSCGNELKK